MISDNLKIALITGAARGIGKAAAFSLAQAGMHVLLVDVDQRGLEKACQEIEERGYRADYFAVDVTESEEVEALYTEIQERYHRLDVLINNAGIARDSMLIKMTDNQFDKVIDVNLKGAFLCGRSAAKMMVAQKEGAIVNISSICGLNGNVGQTNYTASKWGMIGMTKTWAKELGKSNVRVNAIAPGFIETDIVKTIPDEIVESFKQKVALRRVGQPEEVAQAIRFLASDSASFVTGAVLEVTGGMTI